MRILYEPKTLVLKCSECDTVVEYGKDEIFRYGESLLNAKMPDESSLKHDSSEYFEWWDRHVVACPSCNTYLSNEDRIREKVYLAKKNKSACEQCGAPIGENDKYCNYCGATV